MIVQRLEFWSIFCSHGHAYQHDPLCSPLMALFEQAIFNLSKKSSIFCSEADLQHSVAWEVHLLDKAATVHLEYPVSIPNRSSKAKTNAAHIDGLVETSVSSESFAFELKYKTAAFSARNHGLSFDLKQQGAADFAWYDFWLDIQRLEYLKDRNQILKGYAFLLTNDSYLWSGPRRQSASGVEFSLSSTAKGPGSLSWKKVKSSLDGRSQPILLSKRYDMEWRDFKSFNGVNGKFRYLMLNV